MRTIPELARPASGAMGTDEALEQAMALLSWVAEGGPPLYENGTAVEGAHLLLFVPSVVAAFRRHWHLLGPVLEDTNRMVEALPSGAVDVGDQVDELVRGAIRLGVAVERSVATPWFQFDSFIAEVGSALEAMIRAGADVSPSSAASVEEGR